MAHAQELVSGHGGKWPVIGLAGAQPLVVPLPKRLTAPSGQSQVSGVLLSESGAALVSQA